MLVSAADDADREMSEGTERTRQQARALGWGGGEGQYQEGGRHTR